MQTVLPAAENRQVTCGVLVGGCRCAANAVAPKFRLDVAVRGERNGIKSNDRVGRQSLLEPDGSVARVLDTESPFFQCPRIPGGVPFRTKRVTLEVVPKVRS